MATSPSLRITAADLLSKGLPESVVAAAAGDGQSAFSGSGVIAAFRDISRDLIADPNVVDVIGAFATSLEAAMYFINLEYTNLGGASGFLGSPTTAVSNCPDGEGFYRHFNGGSIYWHPAVGAHEVHGVIRDKWSSLGWERSFLGYPTTDDTPGDDLNHIGHFNQFQGGAIYAFAGNTVTAVPFSAVSPSASLSPQSVSLVTATSAASLAVTTNGAVTNPGSNASLRTISDNARVISIDDSRVRASVLVGVGGGNIHEVHGAIESKYHELGAETSILGYPITDESGTPDGIGRYNHFQAGSIYWTPNTGAYEVHGLIRDFWAANGWERNPNLGYPISDELIPDRRIGRRRPESRRKPVLGLASDVIKLPAEALDLGFANTIVNTPARPGVSATSSLAARATSTTSVSTIAKTLPGSAASGVITPRTEVTLNPIVGGLIGPASTPGPEMSRNRFEDFENGVVFWSRGATAATQLAPWMAADDGTSMHLAANDVLAAVTPKIQALIAQLSGVSSSGVSLIGTTNYSFDGMSAQNRRHRFLASLMGMRTASGMFNVPMPSPAMFEVQIEVGFEPEERVVRGFFTDWTATSIPWDLTARPPLLRQLHTVLDAVLWTGFDLLQLEDTNAGGPVAVLSVKTMTNGEVNIYIEP